MRTDLWAKFYAAALSHNALDTKQAARQADKAMEEYDARAKTLENHEREVAELSRDLELARHQRDEALGALIAVKRFVDSAKLQDSITWVAIYNEMKNYDLEHALQILKIHANSLWYILPKGMAEPTDRDNPLLK